MSEKTPFATWAASFEHDMAIALGPLSPLTQPAITAGGTPDERATFFLRWCRKLGIDPTLTNPWPTIEEAAGHLAVSQRGAWAKRAWDLLVPGVLSALRDGGNDRQRPVVHFGSLPEGCVRVHNEMDPERHLVLAAYRRLPEGHVLCQALREDECHLLAFDPTRYVVLGQAHSYIDGAETRWRPPAWVEVRQAVQYTFDLENARLMPILERERTEQEIVRQQERARRALRGG